MVARSDPCCSLNFPHFCHHCDASQRHNKERTSPGCFLSLCVYIPSSLLPFFLLLCLFSQTVDLSIHASNPLSLTALSDRGQHLSVFEDRAEQRGVERLVCRLSVSFHPQSTRLFYYSRLERSAALKQLLAVV